jgi:hypothetical protein
MIILALKKIESKPEVVQITAAEKAKLEAERKKSRGNQPVAYLTRGATLRCNMGSHARKLNLLEGHGIEFLKMDDQYYPHPLVAESEIVLEENICYFGICNSSTPPPDAPTICLKPEQTPQSNQTAKQGSSNPIEGKKCIPKILGGWLDTKDDVVLDVNGTNQKVLLMTSCLVCANMGLIEPKDDGMGYKGDLDQ